MPTYKLAQFCSLLTLLLFVGCSNSSETASTGTESGSEESDSSVPVVQAPSAQRSHDNAQAAKNTPASDPASLMMSSDPSAMNAGPGMNPSPRIVRRQAIPRPDDPLVWTSQHITAAIEERDVKVIRALTAYADHHKGEDQAAQEVVAWLQLLNQPALDTSQLQPSNSGPMNPGMAPGRGAGTPPALGGSGGLGAGTPPPLGGSGGLGAGTPPALGGSGGLGAGTPPPLGGSGAGTGTATGSPSPLGGHGGPGAGAAGPGPAGHGGGGGGAAAGPGPAGHGGPGGNPAAGPGRAGHGGAGGGPAGGHGGPGGTAGPAGAHGDPEATEEEPEEMEPEEMEEGMYESMMMGGPGAGRGMQNTGGQDARIASALIDTLLAIHSLTSYQAARDLLQGNLELPFAPEKTASWTITALIKHVDGVNDPAGKILKQSIHDPDLVRSGSGDFDASRLEDLSLQEHWTCALSVIDGMMGLRSSSLSQPRRQNNNNYNSEDAPSPEDYGTGITPGAYPGAPGAVPGAPNNQPKAEDTNEVDPIPKNLRLVDFTQEEASAARYYLWSPQLVEAVAQRLSESETLMKDPPLLLLAGQMPTTATRYAFQQFLQKNWLMNDDWTRNPASFIRYDVFTKYMREPGLIVTLKQLPREQMINANNANNYGGELGEEGGPPQQNNNRQQNADPEKQREQRVKHIWFETSEKFTLALMDRMLTAASEGHLPESNLDELDIKLHRNASVTLDSRLELALGEPSADPEQDTRDKTTVNYVRIELDTPDRSAASHYRTALRKESQFRVLGNNGMWLSAPVEKDRKTGELVSIDVLLSQNNARPSVQRNNQPQQQGFDDIAAAPGGGYGSGQNQKFVIEILVVRVPNPETFLADPEQAVSAK